MTNKIKIFLVLLIGLVFPVFLVLATTGTIDSTYKYAWSNNIGWINFGCTNCNVQVTDRAITGYAWNENYGWINLNPSASGVTNTTSGDVGGYAWGQNTGWIDFSNVAINTTTGNFSGTATGDVVGTIYFACTATGCPVKTTWTPVSTPVCGNSICETGETCSNCSTDCGGCGGGGGGTNVEIHNICQEEKCIAVSGPGQDQCSTDTNCTAVVSKTIVEIAKTVDETTKQVIQSLPTPVRVVAEEARKALQSD